MCEKSSPELLGYCQTLSKLIRNGELAYSPQIVHELIPYWSEDQRLSQERKFMRGTVDVFAPPTMFAGAHLLKLSSSRIVFGGFQLGSSVKSADMAVAESFACRNWATNMLNEHPSEALLCTVIYPRVSRDDVSVNTSLLIFMDCALEDIEMEAFHDKKALRDCLKNHIQRYTTCEVGIQEFYQACESKSVQLNVQHVEICGGCGRHFDMCNCLRPSNFGASALLAIPFDIMTALAAKSDVSMIV